MNNPGIENRGIKWGPNQIFSSTEAAAKVDSGNSPCICAQYLMTSPGVKMPQTAVRLIKK